MTTREFVGFIPFSIMPLSDAIQTVLDEARCVAESNRSSGVAMHFCNAFNVALARSDQEYRRLLNQGDYIFSDGVPITWVGKRVRPDMSHDWERVYGPDVMQGVFAQSTQQQPRHYLVGGSPAVLEALQRSLAQRYPEAHVVGAESPPFRPATADELRERDSRIADSGQRRHDRMDRPRNPASRLRGSSVGSTPSRCGHRRGRRFRLPLRHQAAGSAVDAEVGHRVAVPFGKRAPAPDQALPVG
jgi:hypothetical protein